MYIYIYVYIYSICKWRNTASLVTIDRRILYYGVAQISRLLKIDAEHSLFCKALLQKRTTF